MSVLASATGDEQSLETKGAAAKGDQMAWTVIQGRKGAGRVVSLAGTEQVFEGTTGLPMATLPKVWAVAATDPSTGRTVEGDVRPARRQREEPGVELGFYRKYTEALLRRYVQMSMEAGRVPSMMGRSVLGGKASSYRIHGFDDAVIFRLDMERCLRRLEPAEREVIRRVAMQEYTQAEAAPLLGICLRTCVQRYGRSLDRFTRILLEARLLEPFKLSRGWM